MVLDFVDVDVGGRVLPFFFFLALGKSRDVGVGQGGG